MFLLDTATDLVRGVVEFDKDAFAVCLKDLDGAFGGRRGGVAARRRRLHELGHGARAGARGARDRHALALSAAGCRPERSRAPRCRFRRRRDVQPEVKWMFPLVHLATSTMHCFLQLYQSTQGSRKQRNQSLNLMFSNGNPQKPPTERERYSLAGLV